MGVRICIGEPIAGYVSKPELLLADLAEWSRNVGVRRADEILLNHVLAPLTAAETERLFSNVARALKLGGHLWIADIDGYCRHPRHVQHLGTIKIGHKPTVTNIGDQLFKYGFRVLPLRYYDASGSFHTRPFDQRGGPPALAGNSGVAAGQSGAAFSSLILEAQLIFDHRKHRMSVADALDVYRGVLGPISVTDRMLEGAVAKYTSTAPLCAELLSLPEFQGTLPSPVAIEQLTRNQIMAVYDGFRFGSVAGRRGFVTGALGDCIDIRFADYLSKFDGTVASSPPIEHSSIPVNQPVEYFAVLSSVSNADLRGYVAVELGAGFGPWLVRAALAAQQRGISNIHLAAVEADPVHFKWLSEHFLNNGLEPDKHQLWCGAVTATDGIAYFPEIKDPAADWGARARSGQNVKDLLSAGGQTDRRGQVYREVKSFSIATVMADFDRVDLLHIDIQGQELEAVRSSIAAINQKVKLMFIGTHDFTLDAELIRCLAGNGWEAKHIKPRNVLRHQDGRHAATADGEQLWINRRLS